MATRANRIAAEALIAGIRTKIDQSPDTEMLTETTGRDPESVSGMRQKLYELQMQEKNLAARYSEDHLVLKQVREQLRHAEEILAEEPASRVEVTRGVNSQVREGQRMLLDAEPRFDALLAKEKAQEEQVDAARADLEHYISAEQQIDELIREKELNEVRYRRVAIEVYRSQIDQGLEAKRLSNISLAEPGHVGGAARVSQPVAEYGPRRVFGRSVVGDVDDVAGDVE